MEIIVIIGYLLNAIFMSGPSYSMSPGAADQAASSTAMLASMPVNQTEMQPITLSTINDISLYDDVFSLLEKKGIPDRIASDPYLQEYTSYGYTDMTVIFNEDAIECIEINTEVAGTVYLDQLEVPVTIKDLTNVLGKPDFEAEDGLVFQRKDALLKLFINPNTKELESIAYYHIAST